MDKNEKYIQGSAVKELIKALASAFSEKFAQKSDVDELKKSAVAEVTTIGAGLKVESGTLSVDCATTDETSAAVSGVLNQ